MGLPALLVGLLSSHAPGILTCRSRGVTPSSVAPECLGDSKRRAGTRIHSSVVLMYAWFNRGSLAVWAMTKPVSRDAKLKGPKVSTGRALVNCTSGKNH